MAALAKQTQPFYALRKFVIEKCISCDPAGFLCKYLLENAKRHMVSGGEQFRCKMKFRRTIHQI